MQIYCDLDGVLADFDQGYLAAFGELPRGNADWDRVLKFPNFYAGLPMIPDALELWSFILPHNPIILSGVPDEIPSAAQDKRSWVDRYLGTRVPAIFCASRDKSFFCAPGDILIDDRPRYRDLWEARGGIWITHYTAYQTITKLIAMGIQNV